ncbi:hypothetical protein [Actinophytocola algeriensis]|uniref:Uncharacterized protein n=1 Tax=Actinophytocola algeriensis TaxID=1768010 RepID=A0A7W7Q1B6_9PSEU|nr:hypothetical protein [Actinophytocola algeriensis]MBB4905184.1 hypothetical protein [Actinophytocola algeriensis]MBE1473131.1 hypothetical protein [Actinophytocola algeriensis]
MTRVVAQLHRLRWAFLATAVVLLVVFLLAQRQTVDVSYAQSPSGEDSVTEGSAGELTDTDLPSVAEMTAMLDEDPVVRLPGSIADWDEQLVTEAIGDADIRVLVTPPGLTEKQQDQLREVENATILVVGTEITGTMYGVSADDVAGWRAQFATGDVTSLLLTLVASEKDEDSPPDIDLFRWRAPTAAELAPVVADLRADRLHVADGATLESMPDRAATAFPDQEPLFAVFPQQPFGLPVPEYGAALAEEFPDTPIVVMYGNWAEYHGPDAESFSDVVAAGVYSRFGDRIAGYAYPQANVLGVYLDQVTDVRYAGLFDRPLPYQPFDPLRVALPVLPWLFALCVLVFLGLSVRSVLGPGGGPPRRAPARLAGLTTLAIEMSGLSRDPALVRALSKLEAVRRALAEDLSQRLVRRLLDEAESELDTAARELGRADYRPANYLAGGIA